MSADKKPGKAPPPDDANSPVEETAGEQHQPTAKRRLTGRHASAAVIGVLTLMLGFAIAVQVHANSSGDTLSGLREDDLIGILDSQNDRAAKLRSEINDLQNTLRQLKSSGNRSKAARQQARQEAQALGVLLGTLPATGPGISVTIADPRRRLTGENLLDVVEELRGAGAEAIQFGPVRVSTRTSLWGPAGSVQADGTLLHAPYQVLAIGDPKTLDTALNIPGGVAATVRAAGGELTVTERSHVVISSTRSLPTAQYATPTR